MTELKQLLISIVNEVPYGYVASYGVVAKELMKRTKKTITAQLIGRQLSGMSEADWHLLPWRRIVNKAGYVSTLKLGSKGRKQIELLEQEGNELKNGTIQFPERREFDGKLCDSGV